MRYALKLFYNGRNFHGSQVQRGLRTVEGELKRALRDLDIKYKDFKMAGRTDKGVISLGNVLALTTSSKLIKPRILNGQLPRDLKILGIKKVKGDFNPRHARERMYKYFLFDDGFDIGRMKDAIETFKGEHSFHNFAKLEGKNPVRRISNVRLRKDNDILTITITGESFLWQMVRRITSALVMTGKNEMSPKDLKRYFDKSYNNKIPPASPENLVLWDVRYDFTFEIDDYAMRKFVAGFLEEMTKRKTEVKIYEEILKEFEGRNLKRGNLATKF